MCDLQRVRECKKTSVKVDARYFWGQLLALGNVTHISKHCMCINASYCIPLQSNFKLFLPVQRKVLDIPVKVRGYEDSLSHHDIMSVEILNPPRDFLDYEEKIQFTA